MEPFFMYFADDFLSFFLRLITTEYTLKRHKY